MDTATLIVIIAIGIIGYHFYNMKRSRKGYGVREETGLTKDVFSTEDGDLICTKVVSTGKNKAVATMRDNAGGEIKINLTEWNFQPRSKLGNLCTDEHYYILTDLNKRIGGSNNKTDLDFVVSGFADCFKTGQMDDYSRLQQRICEIIEDLNGIISSKEIEIEQLKDEMLKLKSVSDKNFLENVEHKTNAKRNMDEMVENMSKVLKAKSKEQKKHNTG